MTTAIYVRISADREGRELGVQRQEQDCRALAERLGLTSIEVYSDNDISATSRSSKPRPGYQRMLAAARAGQVEAVLAYSTSRLTRRPREFEDWIDLAAQGLRITTVNLGSIDLNTARGRERARNDAARDAGYADEISELVTRQKLAKRARGEYAGGRQPFGFEKDGITPRPHEIALIQKACRDVLRGRPLAAVARDWTSALNGGDPSVPVTPRGGLAWRSSAVGDVLRNPRVAAMLPDGTRAVQWEPLVDEATWRGVLAVLGDPARRMNRGPTRLLTGIALCGVQGCSGRLHGAISRAGQHTYRCAASRHLDRRAEPVDAYVVGVLLDYLTRERVAAEPQQAGAGGAGLAEQAAGLRARLAELEEAAADPDGPSPRLLAAAERKLTAELEAVEARLAASASSSALTGLPLDREALGAVWEAADIERRRSILKAVPLKIVVRAPGRGVHSFDPATVVITGV